MILMNFMAWVKTEKNRIMSFLLALLMTVTMIPTTAFAEEGEEPAEEIVETVEETLDIGSDEEEAADPEESVDPNAASEESLIDDPSDIPGEDENTDPDDESEAPDEEESPADSGMDDPADPSETPEESADENTGLEEESEANLSGNESEDPDAEPTVCEDCGCDPCECELEEEKPEDICEDCGEDPCVCSNYTSSVDKIATVNLNGFDFIIASIEEPSASNSAFWFNFDTFDFADVVFEIDDYKIVSEAYDASILKSIWYQVTIQKGTVPEGFVDGIWIFQNYLDDDPAFDTLILSERNLCDICGKEDCTAEHVFCEVCDKYDCGLTHVLCDICGKYDCTVEHIFCENCNDYDCGLNHGYCDLCDKEDCGIRHILCEICGKYDCTIEHVLCEICGKYDCTATHIQCEICGNYDCTVDHIYCNICDKYDCGLTHGYCGVCGEFDCPYEHIYCEICRDFDCGLEHEEPSVEEWHPSIAPVIPENPQLPAEYDVAIVDGSGALITGESGMVLGWAEQASLSAWSSLGEDVAYQWQIFIPEDDGFWVDISGQTEKGLLFSRALLMSALDNSGDTWLRCVATQGSEAMASESIRVHLDIPEGQEMRAGKLLAPTLFSLVGELRDRVQLMADSNEVNTVTVTIHYREIGGKEIAGMNPYRATVPAGEKFDQKIVLPSRAGYAPYWDDDGDGKVWTEDGYYDIELGKFVNDSSGTESERVETIQLTLPAEEMDENKDFDVYYLPIKVNVGIRYFFQNVEDDNYTEVKYFTTFLHTGTIVTEEYLQAQAPDTAGFTRMISNSDEAVAADGSTVFECYYDRDYFLMLFTLDGGYGVEPIYARYGSPVSVPTPIRPGYSFEGWTLDGVDAPLPKTLPAKNQTYVAKWKADDTAKVSVVFWGENPNDEEYSYLMTGVVNVKPGTNYTYANGNTVFLICGKDEHTHTDACKNNTCGKTEHTQHTEACLGCGHCSTACYSAGNQKLVETGTPSQIGEKTNNGIYSYETRFLMWQETHYYLYLNGIWYRAENGDTTEIKDVCNHEHSNTCYECVYHKHTSDCYSCGMNEHTHNNACNQTGSGLNSNLWKFVRSETVTVAADGSTVVNVYYDRTTFTMTFKKEGSSGTTLGTIVDKWGADIRSRFETISKANTFFWSMKQNGGSPWTSFMDVMPQTNRTYYADPQSGSTSITATYLAENLNGEYETLYTVSFKGSSGISVSEEEFVDIEGFTFNADKSSKVGNSYNGSKFYYDRHRYALEFYNPSSLIKKTESVPYEAPLSTYYWEPDPTLAPAKYEPGSVTFAGWYLNPECAGESYNLSTHTMPAATNDGDTALVLYAKWVPKTYTVRFFRHYEYLEAWETDRTEPPEGGMAVFENVPHGSTIGTVDQEKEAEVLAWTYMLSDDVTAKQFGFFYMENGQKKAISPKDIPITGDMNIYVEWRGQEEFPYRIEYVLASDGTAVADPTTGYARLGMLRTFFAKTGSPYDQLYADYNTGYYPLTSSHSMVMQAESDPDHASVNVFQFKYAQATNVKYKVRYLEKGTNNVLKPEEVFGPVADSVVTASYKTISNYVPDAFYKTLTISVVWDPVNNCYVGNDEANVITFYYTKNEKNEAIYAVHHMLQKADCKDADKFYINGSGGYEEDKSRLEDGIAVVDRDVPISPKVITGFEAVQGTYLSSSGSSEQVTPGSGPYSLRVTNDGAHLYIFYKRISLEYKVHFYEEATTKPVIDSVTGSAAFGETVRYTAQPYLENKDGNMYELISKVNPQSHVMGSGVNEIIFYYRPIEYTANYIAVPAEGGGFDRSSEISRGDIHFQGAIPQANPNYKFVGWYLNPDCTQEVKTDGEDADATIDSDHRLTPILQKNDRNEPIDEYTFYAKFELLAKDLTIERTNANPGQIFVYRVVGDNGLSIDVTVEVGEDRTGSTTIANLPFSNYTVTQLNDWSWRYSDVAQGVTHNAGSSGTVPFDASGLTKWLSDVSDLIRNTFGGT